MKHHRLRDLLQESPALRPGQQARAWAELQERRASAPAHAFPVPPLLLALATLVFLALLSYALYPRQHIYLALTESPQAGVYATSFYSEPAQAQVVWLNGLTAGNETPTFQDPTTLDHELASSADSTAP